MRFMPIFPEVSKCMFENLDIDSVKAVGVDDLEWTNRRTPLDAIVQPVCPVLVFIKRD